MGWFTSTSPLSYTQGGAQIGSVSVFCLTTRKTGADYFGNCTEVLYTPQGIVKAVGENRAFEVDSNQGWLLAADGTEAALEHGSKTAMASRIVDAIVAVALEATVTREMLAASSWRTDTANWAEPVSEEEEGEQLASSAQASA